MGERGRERERETELAKLQSRRNVSTGGRVRNEIVLAQSSVARVDFDKSAYNICYILKSL